MHTEPRRGMVTKLGVHTNEGPEGDNTAEGLKGYLLRNGSDGGGYQATFDQRHTAIVVPDNVVCWANGGVNHESLDGCFVGYAAQTREQWNDAFSAGALEQGAFWYASKCKQYGIPARRLTPGELHEHAAKGIFGHIDVSNAGFSGSAGHYDPGYGFPWNKFLARIGAILNPAAQIDWEAIKELVHWQVRVEKNPLKLGMTEADRKDLTTMFAILKHLGYHPRGHTYNDRIARIVRNFKIDQGFNDVRGAFFGGDAAYAALH